MMGSAERIVDYLMPWFMAIAAIITIAALTILAVHSWQDYRSPNLALKKADWSCTDTGLRRETVMVGKVLTTEIRRRCIRYENISR